MSLWLLLSGLILVAGLLTGSMIAILRAFSSGVSAGKNEVRAASGEVIAAAVREKADVDAAIGTLPDAAVRDRLRSDWGRN